MEIDISVDGKIPPGKYILSSREKITRARTKLGAGTSKEQLLIEYDRIGGQLLRNGKVLPAQSVWKKMQENMNKPIQDFSDDELKSVIRQAENSHIPGSLFHRARNEWDMRLQQRMLEKPAAVMNQTVIQGDNIEGDKVAGDKVGNNKNSNEKPGFLFWILTLVISVLAIVIGSVVTEGKIPMLFDGAVPLSNSAIAEIDIATSTPNIKNILDRMFGFTLSADQETFLEKYRDTIVHGTGELKDISKPSGNTILYLLVGRYPVACSTVAMDSRAEDKIRLLSPGSRVSFTGTFTGGGLMSTSRTMENPWYVRECRLE